MAKGFKVISVSDEEYAFIQEFVDKLSDQEGFKLRPAQAIIKAITQYEAKHKMTGQSSRKTGDE